MTYLNKPIIVIVIRGDVNAALYFSTSDSLFLFAVAIFYYTYTSVHVYVYNLNQNVLNSNFELIRISNSACIGNSTDFNGSKVANKL